MSIEVKLTRKEIFEALRFYVEANYPNLRANGKANIMVSNNYIEWAKVECKYESEENPFMPKKY